MPDVRLICEDCSSKWFFDKAHQGASVEPEAMNCGACGGRLRHLLDDAADLFMPHPAEPGRRQSRSYEKGRLGPRDLRAP